MKAILIAVGERAPDWVASGFADYQKRLSHALPLTLQEIAQGVRGKGRDAARAMLEEGQRVLQALPRGVQVITLDGRGKPHTSEQLAVRMEGWRQGGRDLALLIGGPEGLSESCLKRAHETWSLSALTLAHPVVRVVLAEQLYRAWSIINNLPYHR